MYLFPAGSAPRTRNKFGLGAVPVMPSTSYLVRARTQPWMGPYGPIIGPIDSSGPVYFNPAYNNPSVPTPPAPITVTPTGTLPLPATPTVTSQPVSVPTQPVVTTPIAPSTSTTTTALTSSGTPAPVDVSVSTPAASSGYQDILNWLSENTLISSVPNWAVAGGVGLLGIALMSMGKGKR